MPPPWLLAIWVVFVLQAWLSAAICRRFLRLYGQSRHDEVKYTPHAVVIVPFKGLDSDLRDAVASLCNQDYPDYELLLVVQSDDDPATPVLRAEIARHPGRKATVLVAGDAGPNEGQKVHNQLFALGHALRETPDLMTREPAQDHAWVFADSDAVPGPDWLTKIVTPLKDRKTTAVTTGYRWLVPAPGATAWSHLASCINSSVACHLGKPRYNHAWGGAMALRTSNARDGKLIDLLQGALCDDYQFSRLARSLGRRVYFVPQCLVPATIDFSLASLINFAHRQYLLTRVYAPLLFTAALALTTLYVAGLASILATFVVPSLRPFAVGAVVTFVLAHLGDHARSTIRGRIIRTALGEDVASQLRATLAFDRWATPAWMTLHWLLVLRALFGRTMLWRGIRYRLYAPQRCERLP